MAVLEALGRVDADRGALRRADGDLRPARDVAAQVEDAAALGAVDLLALQGLHDADRLGLTGAEQGGPVGGAGARHLDRVPPAAPVAGGLVPPWDLAAGVVVLAAVPVGGGGRAQRGAPVVAAGDRAHPAVGQGHLQAGDQFGVAEVAVELAVAVGGADDVGHAVAEADAEGVGAGAQLVGDVVGGVLDAFGVVRVGRLQDRVAHRFAVDGRLVDAQSRDVEAGAADPFRQGEVVGEQGQSGGQVGGGLPLAGDLGEPCGGSVGAVGGGDRVVDGESGDPAVVGQDVGAGVERHLVEGLRGLQVEGEGDRRVGDVRTGVRGARVARRGLQGAVGQAVDGEGGFPGLAHGVALGRGDRGAAGQAGGGGAGVADVDLTELEAPGAVREGLGERQAEPGDVQSYVAGGGARQADDDRFDGPLAQPPVGVGDPLRVPVRLTGQAGLEGRGGAPAAVPLPVAGPEHDAPVHLGPGARVLPGVRRPGHRRLHLP